MTGLPSGHGSRQQLGISAASLAELAGMFAVLSESTRLRLLEQLRGGPLSQSELVERLGAKQANVSKQLGVLHGAGLVSRERDGALVRYTISEPLVFELVFELCEIVYGNFRREAKVSLAKVRPTKASLKALRGTARRA
jgi:DNA-binding transcriptional ArsR family regulator